MRQMDARASPIALNSGLWRRSLLAVCLGLGLAACGAGKGLSTSDQLAGNIPRPQSVTDARTELDEAEFPNLATVPDRPPEFTPFEERSQIMSALEADRLAASRGVAPRSSGEGGAANSQRQHIADIFFAQASTRLDIQDQEVLRSVAGLLWTRGGHLHVVGHSSEEVAGLPGLEQSLTNFEISLDRARRVAEELERLGVASDRLLVEARSDREPIYRQSTPEGLAGNRRVAIFQEFDGGGSQAPAQALGEETR